LVEAVIVGPLLVEWSAARVRIAVAMDERAALMRAAGAAGTNSVEALVLATEDGITVKSQAARSTMRRAADRRSKQLAALLAEAQALYAGFVDKLWAYRVLDPACGSGNFLYLSLLALKDMELRVSIDAEVLGLEPALPLIGPEAVLGLEINPYAAELARVSVWIGHIQWARRNGFPPPSDPILRTLATIECRDAVLAPDGSAALWPTATAIVGNPPFLGGKRLRNVLGDAYCDQLFAAYEGLVPAEADLVCYWFARAQAAVVDGRVARVGLVATNSIRGGANRRVLESIVETNAIMAAWSDEAWTLDGAAVRVSLVCWGRELAIAPLLDGIAVTVIHADLTAGKADLTTVRRLAENVGVVFMGDTKGGAFDVPGVLARQWLKLPVNPNGRPNSDVLRPWANGMDIARRPSDTWIIDFGWTMRECDAAYYAAPFAYVVDHVRSVRATNKREAYAQAWWRHVEARQGMRKATKGASRFIVTPRVAKHRLFTWIDASVLPDSRLFAVARDDDCTFGILHSRLHEELSLATWSLGS
jgi:type II restriction/modification system DNA methylase subunit YeeA